jgi:hypothetical protein
MSDVLLVNESGWDVAHGNISSVEQWVLGGGRMVVTTYLLRSSPALQTWSGITRALHDDKKDVQPPAAPKPGRTPPRAASRVEMGDVECEPMTVQVDGLDTFDTRSICATHRVQLRQQTEFPPGRCRTVEVSTCSASASAAAA